VLRQGIVRRYLRNGSSDHMFDSRCLLSGGSERIAYRLIILLVC